MFKKSTSNKIEQKTADTKYGKYRNLLVSIVSFSVLVTLLSFISFISANRLSKATQELEIVAQKGVLIQQLSKNLLDINLYLADTIKDSPNVNNTILVQHLSQQALYRIEEVKNQQNIFSQTLYALKQGGSVKTANDEQIEIDAIDNKELQIVVKNIEDIWTPYVGLLNNFIADTERRTIKKETSDYLVDYTRLYNQKLQDEINDITVGLSNDIQTRADILKYIQILGISIAVILFFVIIFGALRQLMDNDRLLEAARRETTEIMATVNTGLFLLDKELTIGNQYSNALEKIMGTKNLSGENLTTVLRNRISEKDLETTRQFIKQLYNPRVKENLVNDLNPLHKILFRSEHQSKSRYLDFKFSRVYENKDIVRILVNVNDVSEAVLLEQRLEKERAQNDLQIEMLTTILNVQPDIIQEFINNTMAHINKINNTLKNPGSSQFELQAKLKSIYREMHSLKGEASSLKLHNFVKIASEAEDKMHALQNQSRLSGNDFLPLTVYLDQLLTLATTISNVGERIKQATNQHSLKSNTALQSHERIIAQQLTTHYQNFAEDIAQRQQKQVKVDINSAQFVQLPENYEAVLKEITIQLLRNAIVHGIEAPDERIANGKSEVGNIKLEIKRDMQQITLIIEDDGRGIDYPAIRHKLVEQGKYSSEQAMKLDEKQLLAILFSSGFSTRNKVDEDGGRGVGLDIIKDYVQKHKGKLNVYSVAEQGTQFVINLPL